MRKEQRPDVDEPRALDDAAGSEAHAPERLVVVGIGASAGGLETLGELVQHVPLDHTAFIVVQHLAPNYESQLPQLLARSTKLTVVAAADGMVLERDHIYVSPPNANLALMHGTLRLITPPDTHGVRLPIDYLFRSLADDQGSQAIGVVLSGTGTDGTFGLKAIKAAGGITLVQDPASAKYDGMPRSALASGAADYCLSVQGIGEELARIAKEPLHRPARSTTTPLRAQDQLAKLFVLIRAEFGNDLSHYKQATIERRIERRMTLHRLGRLEDYVRLVQQDHDELHALYKDMLITVTRFFRDPDVFDALVQRVLPQIFERKEIGAPLRVWVPACASGEEAYSIAMCLLQFCEDHGKDARIQIFGTDLDDECIQHARRAIYPANIAPDVPPEWLSRYFTKKDDEYQLSRRVRDLLVFSRQNVLKDAPFSRIDLASCRNLLIYLEPPAQKRVLRILHYALNPAGYLLLGSSETASDVPELFSSVDRKHKIFRKKHAAAQTGIDIAFGVPRTADAPQPAVQVRPTLSLQGLADRKVIELYGPAGVVLNEDLEIVQFRGHTGPFLDPAQGAASLHILKVARFEMHVALKRALEQAVAAQQRVTAEITYSIAGKPTTVVVDVVPLQDPDTAARCVLVLFRALPPPKEHAVVPGDAGDAASDLTARIHELEADLVSARDYLQATVEDKESMLEELKSANEELQSANEELQSTNEELETSREELQSTNEELTTVNDELESRMTELGQTNDDLHNVLAGIDNPVVIIGMDLRIRRFTSAAEKLFKLVPADVGRSIGFLDRFLGTGALEPKVSGVIQTLSVLDEEVLAASHRWYALKIAPYQTLDHSIRGALLTLVDIDVRKRAVEMTQDVAAYAARFLVAIGHPLLIIDRRLRVVWCNELFLESFQLASDETIGNVITTLGTRQFDDPALGERVAETFASSTVFHDFELHLHPSDTVDRVVRVGGSPIPASGETALMLLSFEPALHVGGAS